MTFECVTQPSPSYLSGVRLMITQDTMTMVTLRHRRWWQIWKPKIYPVLLAETPTHIQAGATVTLEQRGTYLEAKVNGNPVLTYGKRPETKGIGMGTGWKMPATKAVSDPDGSV